MSLSKQVKPTEEEDVFGETGTLKGKEVKPVAPVAPPVEKPKKKSTKEDRLEAMKRKHQEKQSTAKGSKHQISTYLQPSVYDEYKDYGVNKGDKAELINDLLKAYFGIED